MSRRIRKISIKSLIQKQFQGDYFKRLDLVVRYMAFIELEKKKSWGVGLWLYRKMYMAFYCKKLHRRVKSTEIRIKMMSTLIKQAKAKQFKTLEFPMLLTRNYDIYDGAHRLALAILLGRKYVYYGSVKPSHL